MRLRVVTALLVVWWIWTPAVCGAFLSSTCTSPPAPGAEVVAPTSVATSSAMPCHGESRSSDGAPVEGERSTCCDSVDLAVSGKLVLEGDLGSAVVFSPLPVNGAAEIRPHAAAVYTLEELRSPFRHASPPLLN